MSFSLCSLTRVSPQIHERNSQWSQNAKRSIFRLSLTNNSSRCICRVVEQGLEVEVASADTAPQKQSPVIDTKEEEQQQEVFNGVATTESDNKALNSSYTAKKKKRDDDDSYENRFKLQNGREVFQEKAYLVGVEGKGGAEYLFGIEESLKELAQLADTAGLMVVGSTHQKLNSPNPRTYIGSGKVAEIKSAIHALGVETVIFDDELSAGQLRNLEKAFGGDVRVCDRTALILDIFNQRAATHEAALQVALAQMEYQLPRLTKMWSHLERQAGGQVKGMGEKQIEVDKRILRTQIGVLKKELESVRKHRKQYRNRRVSVPVPVVSLVAAFRATLEEISESSLLVHVVDISHPLAEQQIEAVDKVLSELDVSSIPKLMIWNKVDKVCDPQKVKLEAQKREDVVCISALSGNGLDEFCSAVQEKLKDSMVWVEALVPFDKGELLSTIHQVGMVERTEYTENGTLVKAHVPLRFARLLTPMRQMCIS
ncbi:Hflx-type G domain-containing protein [Citrus sinensis]|uniref:Hflx-type G domain-containing protein n=1 Tax=Citrus sinensis TaxID=2711 RepID=A0ACB8KWS7_CITSI|nr:Hflx-type G domain-containing protein [Citrus sinensis]